MLSNDYNRYVNRIIVGRKLMLVSMMLAIIFLLPTHPVVANDDEPEQPPRCIDQPTCVEVFRTKQLPGREVSLITYDPVFPPQADNYFRLVQRDYMYENFMYTCPVVQNYQSGAWYDYPITGTCLGAMQSETVIGYLDSYNALERGPDEVIATYPACEYEVTVKVNGLGIQQRKVETICAL